MLKVQPPPMLNLQHQCPAAEYSKVLYDDSTLHITTAGPDDDDDPDHAV